LSAIELNDEWITKNKNPCFPIDSSWMYMSVLMLKRELQAKKGRGNYFYL